MRTSAITAVAAASVIAVAGCSGGDSPEASAGPTATPTVTVTTTAQPEDVAGRGNCISAGLAYAPIKSGLDGATDLESAVGFFSAPDVDPVTSDAGKASAVAIAEMNLE